ncbi:MAG: menaquinone biosynthesis decarboxylase [Chloroflexota bacterium]|nr:MAG: menaquinone biosynthesis decarboxylase [Chloroflexota bacterium]
MAYKNLGEFIERLDAAGELVRVSAAVSRDLEISEITDRISKGPADRNKALLFERVEGYDIPLLINAFGNERRMAMALGVESLADLRRNLATLIDMRLPEGMGASLGRVAELFSAFRAVGLKPSRVRKGPCQEVIHVDDASLDMVPALQCWPDDGGRYITLMQVITRDPQTNQRNVGMYRVQVFDQKTAAMHWQRHKGGAEHERLANKLGQERIPTAVVLGGDPAQMWCASAPLPPGIDEYLLAGWLRGKPVDFVRCITQPLQVPADAEIVIEGYVDPSDQRIEGPFGDHTGYYTPADYFPTFHVTAITHRENPIYPTTLVGRPPMEDYWMGKATERLFLPLMQLFQGEIVDVNMPAEGVFHNLIIVSIRKRYPGHPFKVCYGLWGLGLMMLTKAIVVVDAGVDVHDLSEVAWRVLGNVDWRRDVTIVDGPTDQLDHSSIRDSFGGKIGIDATAKDKEDGHERGWPQELVMSPEIRALVDKKWSSYGFEDDQTSDSL